MKAKRGGGGRGDLQHTLMDKKGERKAAAEEPMAKGGS